MPSFTYDFPYASKKLPVFASNVVASSQHLAATAGLRMLAKGGNAVDAAIASAIAITIVEPTMNGIGADAFCILWDGTQARGPQRLGPFAGPDDARPVRGPGQHAEHRAGAASACRAECRSG